MIKRATFRNFKLLREVDMELGALNVIVGRNGVGKSSVLEGLHYLLQLAAVPPPERLEAADGPPGAIFRHDRAVPNLCTRPDATGFELAVSTSTGVQFSLTTRTSEDSSPRFDLRLEPSPEPTASFGGLVIPSSALSRGDLEMVERQRPNQLAQDRRFFVATAATGLHRVAYLRLQAAQLASRHYPSHELPRVEHDGEGLASVLQYLHGLRDGTLEAIEADLARVVPGMRRIRVQPAKMGFTEKVRVTVGEQETWADQRREVIGNALQIEWDGVGWIPAPHVSEGTLLALGLITVLRHNPPALLLLDDLDKALHPIAQAEFVDLIKQIIATRPDTQVIATAHSPFVLDALDATEVWVAGSRPDHGTRIVRLDQHPSYAQRASLLRPGEFWSAVGEDWVGRAQP